MFLKTLKILNFKNLAEAEFSLSEKMNCFTGNNGAGKTNILDAVYYLSFTKSFFNTSDSQSIQYNADFFAIHGDFIKNKKKEKIYCAYNSVKKKVFKRNDKSYSKFSEHIGLFPIVIISPDDSILISGPAEERRKYIDSVISQYDKEYLYELIKYQKILSQRNRMLKNFNSSANFDPETIEIYNEQLSISGKKLYEKRKDFISKLIPKFRKYYDKISNKKESVNLRYQSHLNDNDIKELLSQSIEKDKILGYTTKGIHRDDLTFEINEHSLRKSGSQGQKKSFLIALKFAQYEFIKEISKINPMLLLDDIFDKFDSERVEEIIKLTNNNNFGQIFITDTNPERVKKVINKDKSDFKIFHVEKGEVIETDL